MLSFVHVTKRFGAVEALADCSFMVERGRMLGFLGPNGAGKTTAMRTIFGLVEPDAGRCSGMACRSACRAARLRLHAGGARALSADAGRRAARVLRRHPRSCRQGARVRRRPLAEAARPRRPRRREARGALTRQPAARPARGRAAPPAGTARPRRALRGPRPARRADARRRPPRRSRRAARPSSSPATNSTSSSTSAKTSPSSTTAALSRPATSTRSGEPHNAGGSSCNSKARLRIGCPGVDGVELVERRNGDLRLLASQEVDPEQVLMEAERAGRVIAFSYGPPTLGELFMELVAP